jgi:hypothetical protein
MDTMVRPPETIKAFHLSCNLDSLKNGWENRPGLGISFAKDICGTMSSPTCSEPVNKAGLIEVAIDGKGLDYSNAKDRRFIRSIENSGKNVIEELRKLGYAYVDNFNGIGEAWGEEIHVVNADYITNRNIVPLAVIEDGFNLSDMDCHSLAQKKDKTIKRRLEFAREYPDFEYRSSWPIDAGPHRRYSGLSDRANRVLQ